MAARLKAHAWKACSPKGVAGSNPAPSATYPPNTLRPNDYFCGAAVDPSTYQCFALSYASFCQAGKRPLETIALPCGRRARLVPADLAGEFRFVLIAPGLADGLRDLGCDRDECDAAEHLAHEWGESGMERYG